MPEIQEASFSILDNKPDTVPTILFWLAASTWVLGGGYQCDMGSDAIWLDYSKTICTHTDHRIKNHKKSSFWLGIIELLYEKCAAYNLRYCPIAGFTKHGNYISNTLKDFVILVCFLVANFVVFLALFIKMGVHLYFAVMTSAQWLGRSFTKKPELESPVMLRLPTPQVDDSQPKSNSHPTENGL